MAAVPVTRSWHIRRPLHSFCATSPLFVFGLHSPRLSSRISLRRRSVQHDLSATAPAPASAAARNMPAHRNTPHGQPHCVHTCNPLSTVACRSCMPNDSAASLPHTAAARNDITTATTNGRTVNRPRNRILCLPIKNNSSPLHRAAGKNPLSEGCRPHARQQQPVPDLRTRSRHVPYASSPYRFRSNRNRH